MKTQYLILTLLFLLAGCQQPEDDLTQFFNEADQLPQGKLEPLPQVQPFVPKLYNESGHLVDPFAPRKAFSKNVNAPDMKRAREPLEAYPMESLKFVGVISRKKIIFALIQTTDNMTYQVKPGNYIGDKLGQVTALAENPRTMKYELTIRETIQDPDSGEWTVQIKTLELQGNQS